ncbi:MAG: cupin domain-containing protein [Candidatus Methanofastidiosia archaeon]|jgi:mannose-6-phosphate isomerase-like protein (cupin superfamily)
MNIKTMLQEMGEAFESKIDTDFQLQVHINITDIEAEVTIGIKNKKVTITKGSHPSDITLITTTDTMKKIYQGEMTAFTAAGKEKMSDPAPLDWKLSEGLQFTPDIQKKLYFFVQHFFNVTDPEKIVLKETHSRVVHGGHAIPLYYYPGFRSGWFSVKKGEQINEPGDTNPFPQGIIVIKGSGKAKIKDTTISIKAGESYYIPPDSDHVVWTESETPLEIIWLAWGEGA